MCPVEEECLLSSKKAAVLFIQALLTRKNYCSWKQTGAPEPLMSYTSKHSSEVLGIQKKSQEYSRGQAKTALRKKKTKTKSKTKLMKGTERISTRTR